MKTTVFDKVALIVSLFLVLIALKYMTKLPRPVYDINYYLTMFCIANIIITIFAFLFGMFGILHYIDKTSIREVKKRGKRTGTKH